MRSGVAEKLGNLPQVKQLRRGKSGSWTYADWLRSPGFFINMPYFSTEKAIVEIDKLFLNSQFLWKCKRPRIAKMALKENNRVGGLLNFKTSYKIICICAVYVYM